MKNIIILSTLMMLLVSCKKREKTLVTLSLKVKTEKTIFLESFEQEGLTLKSLVKLKKYSDNFKALASSLEDIIKKKRSRKKLAKYIQKQKDTENLCSSYFLNEDVKSRIQLKCNEGYFDVCPLSFAKFEENKTKIVKSIEKSVGADFINKTDCKNN